MKMNRRGFLKGLAATALRPSVDPATIANALLKPATPVAKAFYESLPVCMLHCEPSTYERMWDIFDTVESNSDATGIARLSGYLGGIIVQVQTSLEKVMVADAAHARANGMEKGLMQQLIETEISHVGWQTKALEEKDAKILHLLSKLGIDRTSWDKWTDYVICEKTTFSTPQNFIAHVAGEQSHYFIGDLPNPTSSSSIGIVKQTALQLNRLFPVNVHPSDCAVLRDIYAESPHLFDETQYPEPKNVWRPERQQHAPGKHTQKLIEDRRKGDLLPFELDRNGMPRGNDVY